MAAKDFAIGFVLGGTVSSSFRSSFDTGKKNIAELGRRIKELNDTKLKLKSENMTSDAMIKLKAVRREIVSLKKEAIVKLRIDGLKNELADQKGSLVALGATGYSLFKPVSARADVEQSQGQLASLGVSEKGIARVTRAAEEYVKRYAGTSVPEFIAASYDLKSGIASLSDEGIAGFATLSAKTASATKSSVGTMNKVISLGFGIFRSQFKSDNDFLIKFTAASARAVQAFKTDGDDLALGLANVGASAASMGVKLEEQLAILGVAKKSYNSMSEAGTGYRAFLSNVGAAQKDLGLTFVDSNGHMLPMVQILEKIKNKFGDLSKLKNSDQLKQAFGSDEAVKFIRGLVNEQDYLIQSQKDINKEMLSGTALVEDMSAKMQRGQGFTIMSQRLSVLSSKIGLALTPAASLGARVIGKLASGLSWFIDTFPTVSSVIGTGVITFFSLAAALKAVTIGQLLFSLAGATLRLGMLKSITFTKLWTGAQWLLNAAMSANPIAKVITLIGIVVGLGVTLYNKWKPFRDLWNDIFGSSSKKNTNLSNRSKAQQSSNVGSSGGRRPIQSIPSGVARGGSSTTNTTHITIEKPSVRSDADIEAIANSVDKKLRQKQRDTQDRSYGSGGRR